jgi:hypothetical protein
MADPKTGITEGPWEYVASAAEDGTVNYWIRPVAGQGTGWVGDRYLCVSGICTEDEARAMSAAPELIAALKYARRFLKPADVDMNFIDAALAKATGTPLANYSDEVVA